MKFTVIAVGKLKEAAYRSLADEYRKRIGRYVRCEEREVRGSAELARAIPGDSVTVVLAVDGESSSSSGLAERIEGWSRKGKGAIVFLIGGAEGLPAELIRDANASLSLSPLTLPHRLARVVLYEQLYRAMTLLRGEPYAREE